MNRSLSHLYFCFLIVLLSSSGFAGEKQSAQPNILFILADDVGQEVLECYGGESYPTPHLNELARTGMKFTHAFSMPVCHPTRLTLMTGQYPFRHGKVRWGDFPKGQETSTWSNLLTQTGYQTYVAGKWQLCLLRDAPHHPQQLGFQHSDLFGWHEGPRYYEPMIYRDGDVRKDTLGHYGPDLYVRGLIDFMRSCQQKPFIAYYSMAVCHDVTDDLKKPVPHGPFDRYDSYSEMVAEMDRNIGRLVAALDALDLRHNTLILFIADNGTPGNIIIRSEGQKLITTPVFSQQDGKMIPGGKKKLTDDGTNVPLIANWPGTIQPGQVVDDLIDMSDFLPTFLELAGGKQPKGTSIDGISFAKRLTKGEATQRKWAYAESAVLPKPGGVEPDGKASGLRWVRDQRWKLYNDGRLFDLVQEPDELTAIHRDSDDPEARAARTRLKAALTSLGFSSL